MYSSTMRLSTLCGLHRDTEQLYTSVFNDWQQILHKTIIIFSFEPIFPEKSNKIGIFVYKKNLQNSELLIWICVLNSRFICSEWISGVTCCTFLSLLNEHPVLRSVNTFLFWMKIQYSRCTVYLSILNEYSVSKYVRAVYLSITNEHSVSACCILMHS